MSENLHPIEAIAGGRLGSTAATSLARYSLPVIVLAFLLLSCATPSPIRVDLKEAGWTLLGGQALWKPDGSSPELVTEFIFANHSDGRLFLQVIKETLPVFTLLITEKRWQVESPMESRIHQGTGNPPANSAWIQAALQMGRRPTGKGWQIEQGGIGEIRLRNPDTGESLEWVFDA